MVETRKALARVWYRGFQSGMSCQPSTEHAVGGDGLFLQGDQVLKTLKVDARQSAAPPGCRRE